MVAIHQKHETPIGTLSITVEPETSDRILYVNMEFECADTGAMFDKSYSHPELCNICPIFGESEELMETLREPPKITMAEAKDIVTARFMVRGRKREYPADLTLVRRTYDADKKDAIELRAENAVLRRRLAAVEDQVSKLALMSMLSTFNCHNECNELAKMIKSPLEMLERIANQQTLISSIVDDKDVFNWFKSLNPDLRRFRQLKSDEWGLSRAINSIGCGSDSEVVEIIRYLISIHVDINHAYYTRFYGKVNCRICHTDFKKPNDKWHDHGCTPLDVVRGSMRYLERQNQFETIDSNNGPGAYDKMVSQLREIERILIEAGAKSYADL